MIFFFSTLMGMLKIFYLMLFIIKVIYIYVYMYLSIEKEIKKANNSIRFTSKIVVSCPYSSMITMFLVVASDICLNF